MTDVNVKHKFIQLLGTSFLLLTCVCVYAADICHPKVSAAENNYIIGYGSLIESASRRRTDPDAHKVYPVNITGYQRAWGIHGDPYKTTFLTLIKNNKAHINAIYYATTAHNIMATDKREYGYCRDEVPISHMSALSLPPLPKGKFWIYVQKNNTLQLPSANYPVTQSYVDMFLNGCFEVQDAYKLKNFAENCIKTTTDWPKKTDVGAWVNDRLYPRRPFTVPNVARIDPLLARYVPGYYNHPIE